MVILNRIRVALTHNQLQYAFHIIPKKSFSIHTKSITTTPKNTVEPTSSIDPSINTNLTQQIQSSIQSRRTISAFQPIDSTDPSSSDKCEAIEKAVHRAIQCAITAPNHKRTEPSTFKLFSSSQSIHRLADICYHVTLRKEVAILQNQLRKENDNTNTNMSMDDDLDYKPALKKAELKRNRWKYQVPLYIAVLVNHQPNQLLNVNNQNDEDEDYFYKTLSFVPPATERQLEDYASTCTAIQNIQLSLNAEQNPPMGCKWATGPVIQTPAFRSLIHATPDQFVAGLLMVGIPDASHLLRLNRFKRRFRRSLDGDVVHIL